MYGRRKTAGPTLGPRGWNRPKPEWVRQEIIRLSAQGPDLGCRHLAAIFNRRCAMRGMTVGKTYVSAVIRRHHHEIRIARRAIRRRKLGPGPQNRVWAMDLTGKTDNHGNLHPILGILDQGSRADLVLSVLPNRSTAALLRALASCIESFGKPMYLRTDNEAAFRSWPFRLALWCVGIRHQLIEPRCPWQNGRIERFFGTLKQKLDQWTVDNREQLVASLHLFRVWYNHVRPHQHLQSMTPAEAWEGVDIQKQPPKYTIRFDEWDGLLTGYYVGR